MIWPFSKKVQPVSDEIRQAHAAETRANKVIDQVDRRKDEVNTYYDNLRKRRLQNNFGDALVTAMERR